MYSISKEWRFSASHSLDQLPPDHKCFRLHGHNYRVGIRLGARELDQFGFVVDYGILNRDLGLWIAETFDHQHLNDVLAGPSTAEHLARAIYNRTLMFDWGPLVTSVLVAETEGTTAVYSP